MCVILATRKRVTGEITPVRAEQSATNDNDEYRYGAPRAIDLDLDTRSYTNDYGTPWLKVILDRVYCVEQVVRYNWDGSAYQTCELSTIMY